MKNVLILLFVGCFVFFSCKKEKDRNELSGVPTVLKGKVFDFQRKIEVSKYPVTLVKTWKVKRGIYMIPQSKEIAKSISDENGNYTINFVYNLRPDEKYRLEFDDVSEYYNEYASSIGNPELKIGVENEVDISVWKPVLLRLNLKVLNNRFSPLNVNLFYDDKNIYGTESIYLENISEIVSLKARPNSDISIDFWYYENYNSNNPIKHIISFPFKTDEAEITELDFEIDCEKF